MWKKQWKQEMSSLDRMGGSMDGAHPSILKVSLKLICNVFFFLHMCSKNMIHSKAQRKRWPHAVQQKAAGWRRNLMQCFQIQSKWMRRPHTQNFNWRFLISEIGASTWTPLFKLRKHFPPHPHGLEHQNQTSKLKPSHVFTYYSLDSLDLFDLGLFWNQCLVSLWTARLTFWPRVYRVFVKFLLVTVLCAVLNLR